MTRESIIKRFPRASESFIAANLVAFGNSGLCASNPKPVKRSALERRILRKKTGRVRARISFRIYSVRPADWDGYHVKPCQDCLGFAALLDGDDWDVLQGEVVSEKVHTKAEERTEIEITPL